MMVVTLMMVMTLMMSVRMLNLLPLEGDRCLLLYLHLLAISSHKLQSENWKSLWLAIPSHKLKSENRKVSNKSLDLCNQFQESHTFLQESFKCWSFWKKGSEG